LQIRYGPRRAALSARRCRRAVERAVAASRHSVQLVRSREATPMPLSDLTPEQQKAFNDRLKELQMDPAKVLPKITPATHKGPIIMSGDHTVSHVPPHVVTVASLDELKRVAGNPDALYDAGTLQEHHEIQPPWPQALNQKDQSELDPEQNRRINAAEIAYIYGNSKNHQSYKDIIEKHKFPATFAVFAAEDVCLDSSNSPLIIQSESAHVYGTVTICEGGSIQFEANATMSVQKLVKSTATSCS
jgi:hypothetical protein